MLSMHEESGTPPGAECEHVAWLGRNATHLVYKVLTMIVAQLLRTYDAVKVRLHELLDEVDLLEVFE